MPHFRSMESDEQHTGPAVQLNHARPTVAGKFLYAGSEKVWVRGVTYGTFRPDACGLPYPAPDVVEQDFIRIAATGLNAIRTYTVPPGWLLEAAGRRGLRVMVGIPWEQHITFLDEPRRASAIESRVREAVESCAGHPAILCYAIGNEIPSPIVRWYGRRRVEGYLERLYRAAKAEDPVGLVTYVNYPTTEYLQLPFLDLVCFNVFLESERRFAAYLARLQNLAGDRPLLMTEMGLDSRRHGEEAQARALDWQIRTTFAAGCAGAFVFAWTDEWHRGGYDIADWDFGLTARDRRPKPALDTVRRAFANGPFPQNLPWPRISVIVCTHNGARVIRDCLEGLLNVDYPNFEVIVVNDGSTDNTAAIVREYDVTLITTQKGGLSAARNRGLEAATGEIVAYLDDDAWPDPSWLTYLAATFVRTTHAGVCGPNLPPPGQGSIADCVAHSPGGPIHVLLTDEEAEHIPGCNMAFRKDALEAIGGFDPQFRVAGDDVDVCWRLRERGWTLGYSPGAMVWHRRRNSVWTYWKQQRGYGEAEALLERKWPERYNLAGHLTWAGRVYSDGATHAAGWRRGRVYEGTWGTALFKSLYEPGPGLSWSLVTMPEWYLVIGALGALSALGVLWRPLLLTLPVLVLALGASITQACLCATRAPFPPVGSLVSRLKLRALTAILHLLQPLARMRGRLRRGLTPWKRRGIRAGILPWPRTVAHWNEDWQSATDRLVAIETALITHGALVQRGGAYDRWDLEVRDGPLGATRMRLVVEEHGAGRQLARLRIWPRCSTGGLALIGVFALLSGWAAADHAWTASTVLGTVALLLAVRAVSECAVAMATVVGVVADWTLPQHQAGLPSGDGRIGHASVQSIPPREPLPAGHLSLPRFASTPMKREDIP